MPAQSEEQLYALYPGVDTELIQQLLSYCSVEEAEGILRQMADRPMSARKTGREIVSPPQQQQRAVGSGIGVRRGITSVNDSSDDDEALARRLAAEESPAVDVRMTPSGRPMTSRSRRQVTEDAGVARQLQLEDELAAQRQRSVGGRRVDMTPSPNPSSMDGDGGRPAGPPPQQFDSHSDPPSESEASSETHATNSAYGEMSTNLHGRLEDLWKLIAVYQPEMTVLEPKLRCFIPDYIPAVGDIDPMLKVPEPSPLPAKMDPRLGFRFLDEPNIEQSDPTIVSFELKAQQKTSTTVQQPVHSIAVHTSEGGKHLAQWCQNILDLHTKKMPDRVVYGKRMPGVETLMEAWADATAEPEDAARLEEAARRIVDWNFQDGTATPAIDMPLADLARLVCAVMDVPVHEDKAVNSRCTVESLHLMFSVYAEFKNSQHFGKM